jgi:hypothetical protein
MKPDEFEAVQAMFEFAKRGLRNDQKLGDFLVEVGAQIVALGVRENQEQRELRMAAE